MRRWSSRKEAENSGERTTVERHREVRENLSWSGKDSDGSQARQPSNKVGREFKE